MSSGPREARAAEDGASRLALDEKAETKRRRQALLALLDEFGGKPSTAAELQALRDEIANRGV